jgi:hypothetical protein
VGANMDLTESEAKQFWPVYEDSQRDLQKINRRIIALPSGCAFHPAQGESTRAGSQPGAGRAYAVGNAEVGERAGVGQRSRALSSFRLPSGLDCIAGNYTPYDRRARSTAYPAGCAISAIDPYSSGPAECSTWKRRGVGRSSLAEEEAPYWSEFPVEEKRKRVEPSQHPTNPRDSSSRKMNLGQSIVLLRCGFRSRDDSRARVVQ